MFYGLILAIRFINFKAKDSCERTLDWSNVFFCSFNIPQRDFSNGAKRCSKVEKLKWLRGKFICLSKRTMEWLTSHRILIKWTRTGELLLRLSQSANLTKFSSPLRQWHDRVFLQWVDWRREDFFGAKSSQWTHHQRQKADCELSKTFPSVIRWTE